MNPHVKVYKTKTRKSRRTFDTLEKFHTRVS
jgi:hypothetical protein